MSRILEERAAQSPVMAAWWSEAMAKGNAATFRDAMAKVQAFGDQLGDELVFTMGVGTEHAAGAPVKKVIVVPGRLVNVVV